MGLTVLRSELLLLVSKGMPDTWRMNHRKLSCEVVPLALKSLFQNPTLVFQKAGHEYFLYLLTLEIQTNFSD